MKLVRMSIFICAITALVGSMAHGQDKGWGDVKGQVVWAGGAVPAGKKLTVDKDKASCLAKGDLLDPSFSINAKNKGVRWVMVWLADASKPKDETAVIPVHPSLKDITEKSVEVDQPCCLYEPYVLGMRVGQNLLAKNSSDIAHNVKIDGGANNPNINPLIPAGQKMEVKGWKATKAAPVLLSCSIHPWMKGYLRVFNHPYFAVTDANGNFDLKNAPAGKFRLIVWHPEFGWVAGREGKEITIKSGGTTDLKTIDLKPAS